MLHTVYNALWYPALPIALLASGGRDPATRRQRLGRVDPTLAKDAGAPRIWLHAASVGEIEGVRPVALGILGDFPSAALFITTMTPTGREAAARGIPGARAHLLAPLDWPNAVRRFLNTVRPQIVLIAETELWPNYLTEAHRGHARVAIINGRISQRSLGRYRRLRSLMAGALAGVDLILAQSEADADRYVALGASRTKVKVTGNTKHDLEAASASSPIRPEIEALISGRTTFVAGSTAPGEETMIVDAFRGIRERFPNLMMVLAPRHTQRTAEVEELLRNANLSYVKASGLPAPDGACNPLVLLLDTMGELRALYGRAAVAFVGGSLVPGRGGQNLGEPAAAGIPVLFGPFHENQLPMVQALIEAGGGRVVIDANELTVAVIDLLADEEKCRACGQNARRAFERLGGAVGRTLMHLRPLISLC